MQGFVWWTNVVVLTVASGIDLRTRRAPNWLVLPFLLAGLVAQWLRGGLPGLAHGAEGMALAGLLFVVPCLAGAMGMGDLKLAAGVGAWIGPAQYLAAAVFTALVGAVFALAWAAWHGSLGASFNSTAGLLTPWRARGNGKRTIRNAAPATVMPYAPAIAVGTLLSFLGR
jgi:prepilin peptidase CpaA